MIINNDRGTFSKKYTDDAIKAVIQSLEAKLGALDGDSISEAIDSKATASNITASETAKLVSYNEQGIITGGTALTGEGAIDVDGGKITHAKQNLITSSTYGDTNYIPKITVDEFGHIVSIESRASADVPIPAAKDNILISNENGGYSLQSVDTTVASGSYHLVTSGAVYDAIVKNTTALFKIKGSCTAEELDQKIPEPGDVWNISSGPFAGANYVWVAAEGKPGDADYVMAHWDKLSETLDTSDFLTIDSLNDHKDDIATSTMYGHVMTSDSLPQAANIQGSAGSDNGKVARADHVHPIVTGAVEADQAFPASGGSVYSAIKALEDKLLTEEGEIKTDVLPEGMGESNTWGNVSGDITQQEDLAQALDEKQDKALNGTITLDAANWVSDGDGHMVQAVHIFIDSENIATLEGGETIILNWDASDNIPSEYEISATNIGEDCIRFIYPEENGSIPTTITISALVL